jgi:subtilisin-like proprotein convertase family protein
MLSLTLAALLLAPAPDLRLELVRESLTGTHCRYREYVDGFPTDKYVTTPCGAAGSEPAEASAEFRRAESAPLHWVGSRLARRVIREEEPLHPFAYDYDAESGALLQRVPLFFRANAARVFDPNPVASLNDPSLRDNNDSAAAVPPAAYKDVELQGVAESGPLRGPYVSLVDVQAPAIPPPDAAGSLLFTRADDGFEDVNAYFHIDTAQRYLQSLGYRGRRAIAAYPIPTDAHAQGGFDNSLFLPSTEAGKGSLYFGIGGTDDAEDADIIVHEYGHALLEWIAPATFTGTFTSQARAFAEAFGDYWAFSNHYTRRVASGRDPFCFADWDARCFTDDVSELCSYPQNADCLRRLDSTKTMDDYDLVEAGGVEHRNGEIMSSALRELFLALGKPVADTVVIESVFGAPSLPTYADLARRMIDADQLLYGGAHQTTICAVMSSRKILTVDQCAVTPRGEWTQFPSGERAVPVPEASPDGITSHVTITDTRNIEKLFVRVDIAHSARGDLKIELIAPDGTTALLQLISFDHTRDIHVTYGIDATPASRLDVFRGRSAAGIWALRVADLRPLDTGTLQSWDLVIQFAGDTPAAERPRAPHTQMIPAIGHRFGANDTFFASDLRIANPGTQQQNATLIFTRDGEDGRTRFSAVNVVLAPGETAAYDDVLERVFHTAGIGSLEVLGDVVVMSRTYVPQPGGGTLGQTVPPYSDQLTSGGVAPLFPLPTHRSRIGITDVGGTGASVLFSLGLELVQVDVPAFGHVQLPVFPQSSYHFEVSSGARVVAYVTEVDNTTGDAMFIPAVRSFPVAQTRIAPAVDATGVSASSWRSDIFPITSVNLPISFVDALHGDVLTKAFPAFVLSEAALPRNFGRGNTFGMFVTQVPAFGVAATRIVNGNTSEYVPFVDPAGPIEQQLVFVENTNGFRTNIGFIANEAAVAEVTVFDSEGRVLDQRLLDTPRGLAQMAVTPRVTNGRAVVRFLSGRGRAYASMIDNTTGDAALILGQ